MSDTHDNAVSATDRKHVQKLMIATDDEVAEVVDAITGATWKTRNSIMEDLFLSSLDDHSDKIPAYKPPGQA